MKSAHRLLAISEESGAADAARGTNGRDARHDEPDGSARVRGRKTHAWIWGDSLRAVARSSESANDFAQDFRLARLCEARASAVTSAVTRIREPPRTTTWACREGMCEAPVGAEERLSV
jgi:hypothetical protein